MEDINIINIIELIDIHIKEDYNLDFHYLESSFLENLNRYMRRINFVANRIKKINHYYKNNILGLTINPENETNEYIKCPFCYKFFKKRYIKKIGQLQSCVNCMADAVYNKRIYFNLEDYDLIDFVLERYPNGFNVEENKPPKIETDINGIKVIISILSIFHKNKDNLLMIFKNPLTLKDKELIKIYSIIADIDLFYLENNRPVNKIIKKNPEYLEQLKPLLIKSGLLLSPQ